jgi:DNA helicase-2/ATP-dependent DNA helicase PcrA
MKLSKYQEAVQNFVTAGRGNGIVGAVAGSGKTFTLVKAVAPSIKGTAVFLAFNKSIATELGERLPKGIQARTIHSLAFGAIRSKYRSTKVDDSKYRSIVKMFAEAMPGATPSQIEAVEGGADIVGPLLKLVDLARTTLTDPNPDALLEMAAHYDVDLPNNGLESYVLEAVPKILARGRETAPYGVDFTDMLWLTASERSITPQRFDWVLTDECQDLSAAQLAVVKKAMKRGGRAIFVGDPRQAINGFAGADCDAYGRIRDEMDCRELPLSICYRCPTSHVDLAREIVSHIESAPGAPEGIIRSLKADNLLDEVKEGDMIICRTNAPLVTYCLRLIAEGVPARIKGRDIGKGLVAAAKKIASRRDFPGWDKFGTAVSSWATRECDRILRRNDDNEDDPRLQSIQDRAECLQIIWARCEARNLREFKSSIDDLFSDDRPGVWLSSVHRAKGLENDRIFILKPELLPGPWAEEGTWQYEQEMNLKYVAFTRSTNELIFISE